MLLSRIGLDYKDHPVDGDPELRKKVSDSVGGYSTVPMIFIDDEFIGGFTELFTMVREGKLP